MPAIPVSSLSQFTQSVLRAIGMSNEHADIVASVMVSADRLGVSSHGVAKLSTYVDRVDAGVQEVDPPIPIERERVSSALLNANNGFGHLAATKAMWIAMGKAQETGVGVVSVADSNHFGIAGHYVSQAAEAGLVGIAMTNASPAIAPHNATEKLVGTNPVAFGVPAGELPPMVLDMSSSMVARGRIRREIDEGASSIPEGWAHDAAGRPTTDPHEALAGSLAPIGGAKGAGLSLMIDALTGLLSGSSETGDVANLFDTSRPAHTAHLLLAIDPDAFIGREAFSAAVRATASRMMKMEAAEGRVYYPGLIEYEKALASDEEGVSVSATTVDQLNGLAERFEVEPLAG